MDTLLLDLIVSIILYIIVTAVNAVCFLFGYSLLRLLHIPLDWVMWSIAGYVALASCLFAVSVLTGQVSADSSSATAIGTLGLLVSFHAANQWAARHVYLILKKGPPAFVTPHVRAILLFLRKHHWLLGSLTLLTALSHMLFYLPSLLDRQLTKVVTGFAALGVLLLLVALGLWMVTHQRLYKRPIPLAIRRTHALLSILFLFSLALHI